MKIIVLNRGSSSIKCCLYDFSKLPDRLIDPLWETTIENEGLQKLCSILPDKEIDCIGHRIVHGGKKYKESVLIDANVKEEILSLYDLAPLHNKADLQGIELLEKLFPGKPQIAVFDTAFHHTLPDFSKTYPGPYEWLQMGIQRYGFHGISFSYCSRRALEILGKNQPKMVICHLGSGASLCAVQDGKSIDTTMGLTPLEGLMMDTRSGTIDPGIVLYLLGKKRKTVAELFKELYEKSGLLGLSGVSSDMRAVLEKAAEGNIRARLAVDVYLHRLTSLIGSMVVSLGGVDTLVFTAGIGENASFIRQQACNRLSFLGIHLADVQTAAGDRIIS
ncbi:MAG: acetate/propionate family kinase, partial [Rhabdochlamydiaceae bacterium]